MVSGCNTDQVQSFSASGTETGDKYIVPNRSLVRNFHFADSDIVAGWTQQQQYPERHLKHEHEGCP